MSSYRQIKEYYVSESPPKEISPFIYNPPQVTETGANKYLKYRVIKNGKRTDPQIWGPCFWFSLHNGATLYPKNASPFWRKRMKNFILGIPVMIPCEDCCYHATAYIDSRKHELDTIVMTRENVMLFFIDFHNFVNARYGKRELSTAEAKDLFTGNIDALTIEYGLKYT